MAEGVEIPITASGGAAAARELGKAQAALGEFSRQAATAGRASEGLAGNSQKVVSSLSALGGALSQIDPVLGQFGAAVGRAGGAIGSMTALIGGGPGVLFGGAVAAIGLLATAWRDSVKDAEAAAKAAELHAKSLNEQAKAAEKARLSLGELIAVERQRATAVALAGRVGRGSGSVEEQRGYLRDVELRIAEATAGQRSITSMPPELRAELERARQGVRDAEAFANAEGELDYLGFGSQSDSGGRRGGGGDFDTDRFRAAQWSEWDLGGGGLGRDRGVASDLNSFFSDRASRNDFGKSGAVSGGGVKKQSDESIKQAQRVKDAWLDAGASISDGFAQSFAALITGGKDAAAAVLASLGDQMVAEGSRAVFSGLFQTVLGNPMGPTMIAIGGAEIAFGAGLGATMSGASTGGGGGGGRPSPGMSRAEAAEQGPQVINVYALNPTAETGRVIQKSTRMANRKRVS